MNLISILQSGLCELDLEISGTAQEKIIKYIELLHKWNQAYNLTAVRDPMLILIRHIFDSLSVHRFIVGPNVLDFGAGAGLPGIPLALMFPNYNFVLLDSVSKKTRFLNHAMLSLDIKNIDIVNKRAEDFSYDIGFDTIITRATTRLNSVVNITKHMCVDNGQILVMKGKYPIKELAELSLPTQIYKIKVPRLDEERHLVKILRGNCDNKNHSYY